MVRLSDVIFDDLYCITENTKTKIERTIPIIVKFGYRFNWGSCVMKKLMRINIVKPQNIEMVCL